MTIFLQSLGSRVAKAVNKPFSVLIDDENTWSDIATKKFDANVKVHYALLQVLNDDDIARVIHCISTYEIWAHLVSHTRERHKSREQKIVLLHSHHENFTMRDNDSIDDMVTRFNKITNGLAYLGDVIDNDYKVRKVICALSPSWEIKATTLKKLNDKEVMELICLIENLKTQWRGRQEKRWRHKRRCSPSNSFPPSPTMMMKKRRQRTLPTSEKCKEDVQ